MAIKKEVQEFYDRRMKLLGVTKENNIIKGIGNELAEWPMPEAQDMEIFRAGRRGIDILYYTLDRWLISYVKMGDGKMSHTNGKPTYYFTTRLAEPDGDRKYLMPKGQGTHPWFPPELMEKYAKKEKVKTLFLTEGVFKAWKAAKHGLNIVGLSSITHYRDREGNLHHDIVKLIVDLRVEEVVIMWDGDCLDISESALAMRDELTKRPKGFYSAAKNIRKLVKEIKIPKEQNAPSVWYMYPKSETFGSKPKGLDDMLIAAEQEDKVIAVIQDAKHPARLKGPFFYRRNIDGSMAQLYEHFGLKDINVFYNRHIDLIGSTEFNFHGDLARWNDIEDKLEVLAPKWAKQLRWIGNEFFVINLKPGLYRNRRVLEKMDPATLTKLYGKDFYKKIPHFAGFCNVPSHFKFEQVIELEEKSYYNRYFPFKHVEQEGTWNTILGFVKHIFGEQEIQHPLQKDLKIKAWEMGLDYVQILLTDPRQVLPVMCLYSQENSTGKSTWGKLLAHIFGDNVTQIGNADLQSDFNEPFADKLLAICEETLLERKKEAERIKALSTSDQILVNPKGQRQFAIDFFCKFMFFSNNKRMIYLTQHDERFWVIQVKKAKTENVRLLDEMKAEVPAFIAHLKTRKLATPNDSRMHFHPQLIRTDAFFETVKVNEPGDATDLRTKIADVFLQDGDLTEFRMDMKSIKREFFGEKTKTPWVQELMGDYLNVDLERDTRGRAKVQRGTYPKFEYNENTRDFTRVDVPFRGRPYLFLRTDFFDDENNVAWKEPSADTSKGEVEVEQTPF